MRFGMMMENRHMKKIRKVIKFLSKKLNILQEKVNMLYVATDENVRCTKCEYLCETCGICELKE